MTEVEHDLFTQIESNDFMSDPLRLNSETKAESSNQKSWRSKIYTI